MLRLVLVRHGKSSWKDRALRDHDRPLAARGRDDARRMGAFLAAEGLAVDEVLCSTAKRTRQTWALIEKALDARPPVRFERQLYLPPVSGLARVIESAKPSTRTLVVVGHTPSLDGFVLARGLGKKRAGGARVLEGMPTCSVAMIDFPLGSFAELGHNEGTLVSFTTPRELRSDADERPLEPHKGEKFEITRETSLLELAALAFGSAVAQLRENGPGARDERGPGFAHQQRVGLRKLRVYLRLFRKFIGKQRAEQLTEELRWLFRALGAVREHDVFEAATLPLLAQKAKGPALKKLARSLADERTHAQERLHKALASARYQELVTNLVALEAELHGRHGHKGRAQARPWLKKRLTKRYTRLSAALASVEAHDATSLHDLRKELKKLRYTAELARGAFERRAVKEFLGHVEALQDVLGAWNDSVVAEALVRHGLGSLAKTERRGLWTKLAPALEAARAEVAERLDPALGAFHAAKPFWR